MGKILIGIGVILIMVGALLVLLEKTPFTGKLPGDIIFKRGNFTFYFPVVTCVIVSIILSFLLWLIGRR